MIKPLLNNILIEKIVEKSSIIIPDSTVQQRAEGKGRVVAVGQGIRTPSGKIVPLLVKEGDIVLFTRYSSTKIDGKEYYITKEEFIVAIEDEKTVSK